MVERYRRGKRKKELLGNHQKCWLWGRHVVLETLRAAKWPVIELHLDEKMPIEQRAEAEHLAAELKTEVLFESSQRLKTLCHSSEHQGYLAKMPSYPYDSADEIAANNQNSPLFAILDSIQDPYNFGAILRSADAMKMHAIFVGETNQVEVTSLVARSSAGAVNHVRLARVPDLATMVNDLRSRGITIVAASEKAQQNVFEYNFCQPTAIVIGNEGAGISHDLIELADRQVKIPQFGQVGSLNAAVSAGILFYEARRQRETTPAKTIPTSH